jgi:hypothetical protein
MTKARQILHPGGHGAICFPPRLRRLNASRAQLIAAIEPNGPTNTIATIAGHSAESLGIRRCVSLRRLRDAPHAHLPDGLMAGNLRDSAAAPRENIPPASARDRFPTRTHYIAQPHWRADHNHTQDTAARPGPAV